MKIADLNLLSDEERSRLIDMGRGVTRPFPADKTIAEIFREQVDVSPTSLAVVCETERLTYQELDDWSDRVATNLIQEYGVGPDRRVALCFGRGIEMIVAIISVWKAGGAYVPMAPDTPSERARFMVQDAGACVVICGEEQLTSAEWLSTTPGNTPVTTLDGLRHAGPPGENQETMPESRSDASDLAYIIYTSGTTGTPKGVMIENRSVVNHVWALCAHYEINKPGEEVVVQLLNYAFDGGVLPMILALLTGNTLLVAPDQLWLDGERLTKYLNEHGATHINGMPTFFKQVDLGEIPSLKRLIVGGEALDADCFRKMKAMAEVPVFNEYGPTETTISTISQTVREYDLAIGRPHYNAHVLILDDALRPVPVGAVGEIFVGGPALARGYLNQPELTGEKFIDNPFQSEDERADLSHGPQGRNARLYRTGDLARWRSDGVLDLVGRNDSQVKLRGFRVELGEIESVISTYPGVSQSVVLPDEAAEEPLGNGADTHSLTGYYVAETPLDHDEIRQHLSRMLPSYMVPSTLVHTIELPLMAVSGKLDTQALRALNPASSTNSVEPRTELETKLRELVASVIEIEPERVGMTNDIFQLGLNSILVTKLKARILSEIGISVNLASLFDYPTISELAESPDFADAMP